MRHERQEERKSKIEKRECFLKVGLTTTILRNKKMVKKPLVKISTALY